MEKYTTFGAPFLRSSLPPDTKILCLRIYFRVNTTDIENKYELYSRTCTYGSSIIEVVDSAVSYTPVSVIHSLRIIIAIEYTEGLIIIVLDISNPFQITILTNPEEIIYISLPRLYLEWLKIKWPKHPLAFRN